jgi:GAF domain-containing protein
LTPPHPIANVRVLPLASRPDPAKEVLALMPEVSLARVRQVANLARSVASTLDLDSVLRQVVEAVLSLRPGASCVVRLRDPERGGYRVAAMGGADVHGVASVIPFGSGITHAVMQSGQPMLLPDAVGDPRLVAALWRSNS